MGKYFGTDGFRGEANIGLTVEHAYRIGRFLGYWYGRDGHSPRVVIGKDTRRSCYMLEHALVCGLTASGADAYLLHVTTTPSVAYITRTDHFDCGVMVSASHNPYYDNGIKLVNGDGEKMEDEVQDACEKYIDGLTDEIPFATGEKIGKAVDYVAGRNRYIGYLISLATVSYNGLKVGLDCANGSTWQIAQSVFNALGAKTYVIGNEPTGFNINLDCGSTHIEQLQQLVREKGLDIGFAFDGDADRCLCVDEKGNVVNGDQILYIYAGYMQERGKLGDSKVVTTVMSNYGLYKALEARGIGYEQTKVGDRYVYENMRRYGHRIGGEQSGHIIFSKYATTGDGLLTAIKIMQAVLDKQKTLSELAAPCKMVPQVLKNVVVDDKEATLGDPAVLAADAEAKARLSGHGRTLLRASGTEPVLRVMAESTEAADCAREVDFIIEAIKNSGHLVKVK